MNIPNKILKLDKSITYFIYKLVNNNKFLRNIPYYFGLLPYELYVLPGMFISIMHAIWLESINPIQFHLLPHWFAYSIFQLLKGSINRVRPGCGYKEMNNFIDSSHCSKKIKSQSFPSGHTGVAFSLAVALFMELKYSDNPKIIIFEINNKITQNIIATLAFIVACMISIHRISKGYHHFGDVIIGAVLGSSIGYMSWKIIDNIRNKYFNLCKNNENNKNCDIYNRTKYDTLDNYKYIYNDLMNNEFNGNFRLKTFIKIIISIAAIVLNIKFFRKDIYKLAKIKH